MEKNWIEIIAKGPRGKKDEAGFLLIQAGSPGIVEEVKELKVPVLVSHSTWDRETFEVPDDSPTSSYKAYIPAAETEKLPSLKEGLERLGWSFSYSDYKYEDWSTKWQAKTRIVKVTYGGSSIILKPTWMDIKKKPGDIVIEIDPGMAFGTGGHDTTKMCLKAIALLLKGKKAKGVTSSLLDVGTGTGILAIAAKKLKTKEAIGVDIDPIAVKVARKNAKLNKAELELSTKPVQKIKGVFPVVVANILAGELIKLAPTLTGKVRPDGFLILSGILKEEKERVKAEYLKLGLKGYKEYSSGEWAALVLRKP